MQAVPQVARLKRTTTAYSILLGADVTLTQTCPAQFKCFEPPVKLSNDELRRPEEYRGYTPSPAGGPDGSPTGDDTISGRLPPRRPGENNYDGAGHPVGTSLALQALYANDAVKHVFMEFDQPSMSLDLGSDDDDDDNWEDIMDLITFAGYYAAGNPLLAKIVQEHDQKMRERRDQRIVWVEGVQSEIS